MSTVLPEGVTHRPLIVHADQRGTFTEIFRAEWKAGLSPVQWNVVQSAPDSLRGVHVHIRHADYLIVLAGHATIGLRDLRPGSPTEKMVTMVAMDGANPAALAIPAGVAHGFMFHAQSTHIYAVSEYWNVADELGCHWQDPDLQMSWPAPEALVSKRDADLPPLTALLPHIPAWRPSAHAATGL